MQLLIDKINEAFTVSNEEIKNYAEYVNQAIELLDSGKIRVAEKINGEWHTNEWVKRAILLLFRVNNTRLYAEQYHKWFDKIDAKFANWNEDNFKENIIRAVPGCYVRKSAFIGKNTILMPSFVNVGAYVGDNTLVDTWATIGSCAQIGKNCHISGGVGIGGVLEPLKANPVIIEDNCFIGARSEVVDGCIIGEGSVLSMGVYIGASTKIIDRETGDISYGKVPPYSVVVPGSYMSDNNLSIYAAIIVKKVDEQTRQKTAINEILRGI